MIIIIIVTKDLLSLLILQHRLQHPTLVMLFTRLIQFTDFAANPSTESYNFIWLYFWNKLFQISL